MDISNNVKTLVATGAAVTIMQEVLLARVSRKETQVRPVTKTILGANNTPLNVTGSAKVDISVCGTTVRHEVLTCNKTPAKAFTPPAKTKMGTRL